MASRRIRRIRFLDWWEIGLSIAEYLVHQDGERLHVSEVEMGWDELDIALLG